MNKTELVNAMLEKMPEGTTKKTAEAALNAFVDTVTETLASKEEIALTGFGSFKVSERKARTGRNPQTGETMQIAASTVPGFKAGKKLKDAVNGK
ncbi:HU family DNA-binding protein [Haloplasma contractile]|uniref:DNA-binding protein HU n=1 Tax=Haloplasma contractile SSD-17B TaxID=1033810 RepID=U2DY49_9MOLU|nr:HU family DNA-binding protein [Haloplasma contractile]ERJ13187.1 DNA-binding protein HU [Haloplasma contractile SSD-17B]